MAVGPQDVAVFDNEKVTHIILTIDERLRNTDWVKANRRGTSDHYWFSFAFARELGSEDKRKIIEEYTTAGWGSVAIINSSENNERPGIVGITLYKDEHAVAIFQH